MNRIKFFFHRLFYHWIWYDRKKASYETICLMDEPCIKIRECECGFCLSTLIE